MKIRLCREKKEWDDYFNKEKNIEFLQSWDWGEFQQSVGNEVIRLQVVDGEEVMGQIQGFVQKLPFGLGYLYIPRVYFSNEKKLETRNWKPKMFKYIKEKNFVFARVELVNNVSSFLFPVSFTKNRQPQTTLVLDISKSEEILLSEMHAKTRYNIRLAEKKGVIVKQQKNVEDFWKLNEETSDRDEFTTHNFNYYKKMIELDMVYELTAYYDDKPIASNIYIKFNNKFIYLHGASGNEYRNLMAPYLLQWEGVKLAKKLNCEIYDFWGIAPLVRNKKQGTKSKRVETCFHNLCWQGDHRWTGVTRFKAGFGGEVREYPQAVDLVLNKFIYYFYRLAKRLVH